MTCALHEGPRYQIFRTSHLHIRLRYEYCNISVNSTGKEKEQSLCRPRQALCGPVGRGSQISRNSAYECGKFLSPTHWPPLPPKEIFLVLVFVRGWVDPRAIMRILWVKISNDTTGNRNRDLPACSAVLRSTAPSPTAVKTPWRWRRHDSWKRQSQSVR